MAISQLWSLYSILSFIRDPLYTRARGLDIYWHSLFIRAIHLPWSPGFLIFTTPNFFLPPIACRVLTVFIYYVLQWREPWLKGGHPMLRDHLFYLFAVLSSPQPTSPTSRLPMWAYLKTTASLHAWFYPFNFYMHATPNVRAILYAYIMTLGLGFATSALYFSALILSTSSP